MKRPASAVDSNPADGFRSFVDEVFNTKFAPHLRLSTDEGNIVWPGREATMRRCFLTLEEKRRNSPDHAFLILETGTCRDATFEKDPEAPGLWRSGASTYMFDAFVNFYNGAVYSWDINKETQDKAKRHLSDKTVLMHGDSVAGLHAFFQKHGGFPDLVYLDSFDLCWLQPEPSAEHHMKELCCVAPFMARGSVLLVDDSPNSQGILPPWVDNRSNMQLGLLDEASARQELSARIIKEVGMVKASRRPQFTALKTAAASDTAYEEMVDLFLQNIPGTTEHHHMHGTSELLPGKGYLIHEYLVAIGVPEVSDCAGYQRLYIWP